MNLRIQTALVGFTAISVAMAATPSLRPRLTARRVAELTDVIEGEPAKAYKVEISDLGSCTVGANQKPVEFTRGRELIFPTEFDPPQAAANGAPVVTPTTPTAFGSVNSGWTVRLTAKPHGRLVAVYGVAEYVEAEFVNGGYGEVAGPIHTAQGRVITPNKLQQPKLETTTTRFNVFALPGESYEVTFYRGARAEKHTVAVSTLGE